MRNWNQYADSSHSNPSRPCPFRRRREYAGMHFHAGRDSEHRQGLPDHAVNVPGRAIAPGKDQEIDALVEYACGLPLEFTRSSTE